MLILHYEKDFDGCNVRSAPSHLVSNENARHSATYPVIYIIYIMGIGVHL